MKPASIHPQSCACAPCRGFAPAMHSAESSSRLRSLCLGLACGTVLIAALGGLPTILGI